MVRSPVVRLLLGCAAVVAFYLLGVGIRQLYGSCVDIRNSSKETVRNVSVKVESGGKTVALPDLAPGSNRRIYVQPPQKSRVFVTITDSSNRSRDIMVFSGARPGDCGLSILTTQSTHNTESNEFHQPVCWKSWLDF